MLGGWAGGKKNLGGDGGFGNRGNHGVGFRFW